MNTMSVEIVDPHQPVSVTDTARRHFLQQCQQAGHAAVYLSLKESGCTGYMYVLDLVDEAPEHSLAVRLDGDVRLYIARAALPYLQGTVIDYVRNGLNRELQFQNPNAGDYCGCGESFSISEAQP